MRAYVRETLAAWRASVKRVMSRNGYGYVRAFVRMCVCCRRRWGCEAARRTMLRACLPAGEATAAS